MALSVKQIKAAVQTPAKKREIARAIDYQNRIKFHVNTRYSREISVAETRFLEWVRTLIPADKFETFRSLYQHPVKTAEVAGIAFDRLSRVFDGRNAATNFQFLTTEDRDDWEWYRQEVLGEPGVWRTKGWEFFKTEINSILVVDLPADPAAQVEGRPAPYFYWLRICDVIDYRTVKGDPARLEWVIFRTAEGNIAVYDDETYRVFEDNKAGNIGAEISSNAHDLGYCPSRFFWEAPLDLNDPDIKWHPLAKVLSGLDWYLFFSISKKFLDLFGAYPIYSGYETSCDYNNEVGECVDGYIKGTTGENAGVYLQDFTGNPMRCPKCSSKRIVGPGSFVEIPVPDGDSQPDLRDPVQMLAADVSSLEYNTKEENRLREQIITSVAGQSENVLNEEAVNETQVNASFEPQTTVLVRLKEGFEGAANFVNETECRLRYGSTFVSSNINLGTEFYITSAPALREQYAKAKSSGASEAELDALHSQIIETEYRNDPIQMQRMIILADLEPYRHMSRAEVIGLDAQQLVDYEDLQIKLNFATFVRRFEREQTNIIEFGAEIPYETKIETITNTFKSYVGKRPEPPAPKANAGNL